MKRLAISCVMLLMPAFLRAQYYTDAALSTKSRGIEVGILGNWDGIKTNLGVSGRYYSDERKAGGFAHLLFGLPVGNSNRFFLLLGPQIGVMPGGKPSAGVRVEIATNNEPGLRFGFGGEQNFANIPGNSTPSAAFAYVGWVF